MNMEAESELVHGGVVETEELLIDLIQNYEYLFNMAHKDYKNSVLKEAAWADMAAALNKSVKECQTLWKTLRNKFTREKREGPKSGASAEERWPLFKKMLFFDKYHRPRKTHTTTPASLVPRPQSASSSTSVASPGSAWDTMDVLLSPEATSQPLEVPEVTPLETAREVTVETPRSVKKRKANTALESTELLSVARSISEHMKTPVSENKTCTDHICAVLDNLPADVAKEKRRKLLMILYED